jgi:hypothetical protein
MFEAHDDVLTEEEAAELISAFQASSLSDSLVGILKVLDTDGAVLRVAQGSVEMLKTSTMAVRSIELLKSVAAERTQPLANVVAQLLAAAPPDGNTMYTADWVSAISPAIMEGDKLNPDVLQVLLDAQQAASGRVVDTVLSRQVGLACRLVEVSAAIPSLSRLIGAATLEGRKATRAHANDVRLATEKAVSFGSLRNPCLASLSARRATSWRTKMLIMLNLELCCVRPCCLRMRGPACPMTLPTSTIFLWPSGVRLHCGERRIFARGLLQIGSRTWRSCRPAFKRDAQNTKLRLNFLPRHQPCLSWNL